jgi:hypothetical protein
MKKISYIKIAFIAVCSQLFNSCDYLAVSDELAGQLTKEAVFNKPDKTRQWHRHIFTAIPDYSSVFLADKAGEYGFENPWMGLTDEIEFGTGNSTRYVNETGFHEGNARYHRYKTIYKLIRQANIFLQESHVIETAGTTTDYLDAEELQELKAQARFLRAYYYHLLLELYGPVPLITEIIDPNIIGAIDFSRNSVDEIVDYICKELDALIEEEGGLKDIETDENRLALPTKGVARAVKAKTLVFAASPLFNGGFAEALTVTNPEDGKRLFPDHDPKKWNRALAAIEDFISFANAGNYSLHKVSKKDGTHDPDQSLYDLFMSYNDEIIWASSKTWFNKISDNGYDKYVTPLSEIQGKQTTSVMQELVDDFYMKDGLSIEESPLYQEEGFTKMNGVDVYNMWVNREPRFYQAVFYQGRKWHVSNKEINFYMGSHNGAQASPAYTYTGYLCYKRASRKVYNQGSHPKVHYRPSIIFRLADFYLLYAEALNEVRPSDPKIIEYVDKVRERAGVPKLADIKPGIIGDQNAQREAIVMERRIELCTEGQRYFDVRRWMIAEKEGSKQGGDIHGMNMFGASGVKADFYKRTRVETRLFEKKYYLYPIPLSEIQISEKLVQNPLW